MDCRLTNETEGRLRAGTFVVSWLPTIETDCIEVAIFGFGVGFLAGRRLSFGVASCCFPLLQIFVSSLFPSMQLLVLQQRPWQTVQTGN